MTVDEPAGSAASEAQMAEWARALTDDPTAPVYRELGAALLQRGAPKRAALVLSAALHHHPEDAAGRILLGEAQIAAGDPQGCAREMARLLADEPDALDGLLLLARSLRLIGQYDEAAVIIRRAETIAPHDPRVRGMVPATGVVEEPTVVEEPPDLTDLDDELEDATRPMPSPFEFSFEGMAEGGSSGFDESVDDSGDEPTVQVSPSLALEAAELVAAGLLSPRPTVEAPIIIDADMPRTPSVIVEPALQFDVDDPLADATRPLSIVHSIELESMESFSDAPDPTRPLTHPSIRPRPAFKARATHAEAPPSMRAVLDAAALAPRRRRRPSSTRAAWRGPR